MIRFNSKIRIKRYKSDEIAYFLCFYVTLMIFAEMFETIIPAQFKYADEIFALIALMYIGCRLLLGYSLRNVEKTLVISVSLIVLCGILGNIIYGIHKSAISVVLDVFLFIKIYASMLLALMAIKGDRVNAIYHYMLAFSKLLLCIVTFLILLDAALNGWQNKYSIFFTYYGSLSWWVSLFFAIVYTDKTCKRLFYFICTAVIITKNGSDLGLLSLGMMVVIYLFVEKSRKFRWYHFAIMLCVGAWIGWQDIGRYLMNVKAPRFLLIYYGFITANRYFPLGSGFATYASAQAARTYSKLYYEYGFDRVWGMTPDTKHFIQDSYYPVVVGQTGYIGTIVFAIFMCVVMKRIVLDTKDKYFRCGSLIVISTWLAAGIGFLGSATSWGCCVFIVIVLLNRMGERQIANNECLSEVLGDGAP